MPFAKLAEDLARLILETLVFVRIVMNLAALVARNPALMIHQKSKHRLSNRSQSKRSQAPEAAFRIHSAQDGTDILRLVALSAEMTKFSTCLRPSPR